MAVKQSRYLGVQPFKTSDQHIFFGRDEDVENLLDIILLEKLIVLFGKSGYGKSSLLSAGIIPRLTDNQFKNNFQFHPLEIRFGKFVEGQSFSPLESTQRFLKEIPFASESNFLNRVVDGDTLWLNFKQRQTTAKGQFILIFDQFEEFFSYPLLEQELFRRQLAEALYSEIPQSIRSKLDALSDEQRQFIVKPMNIKVVFAIRSDRISSLNSMKDVLPAILHKRYELLLLTPAQAREAIVKPAGLTGNQFSSPPFEYTESSISAIMRELAIHTVTDSQEVAPAGIEAFQLQILCEYIEHLVRAGKVSDLDGNGLPDITESELPEITNLYENYYQRKISELDEKLQNPARLVLEEGLLAEEAGTGEPRRVSVDSRALIAQFSGIGLTENLLNALEKTYLIRREINTVGGFSFEISHDTLVIPIQKAKVTRREQEESNRLQREQEIKEQQIAEAQFQASKEKRRRRQATILAILAVIGLIIALIAMFWAITAQQKAEKALQDYKIAEQKRLSAEANSRKIEFDKYLKLAHGQLSGGNSCLSDETFNHLEKNAREIMDDDIKNKIIELNEAIQKNNPQCPLIKIIQK